MMKLGLVFLISVFSIISCTGAPRWSATVYAAKDRFFEDGSPFGRYTQNDYNVGIAVTIFSDVPANPAVPQWPSRININNNVNPTISNVNNQLNTNTQTNSQVNTQSQSQSQNQNQDQSQSQSQNQSQGGGGGGHGGGGGGHGGGGP